MLVALGGGAVVTAGASGTVARPGGRVRVAADAADRPGVAAAGGGRGGGPLHVLDSLLGRSGKLRARFISQAARPAVVALIELVRGVGAAPGVYVVDSLAGLPFSVIAMRPFSDKVHGRIGQYRIGTWPFERGGAPRTAAYRNPDGFIEVTPQNQDTYVSEHFRLRDFLTHDQRAVWPKYLVLNERLIDKLELVVAELNREGYPVRHLAIMSGFRTPQYNAQGVGAGGRAATSRHQYGDAADVFVDNNEDGWADDVNGDGVVDIRDAEVVRRAAEQVEREHPELVGGIGVYRATAAHGPFTHIDARGYPARWGGAE